MKDPRLSRFSLLLSAGGALLCLAAVAISSGSVSAQERDAAPIDYQMPQVGEINAQIARMWEEYQLSPSAAAPDGEWCRRVYLDILGRVPSVEELAAFTSSTEPAKKMHLVEMLLYDEKYTEEYARNWTTLWTNVLIGRSGGTERNTLTNRAGMQKYLRDSFARNKPYDRMVYELVTASGVSKPGMEGFNGAVNFLAMKVNEEEASQATADTTRIFLGLQVQCTQCHNHPFNQWKQQKYWEMNAFFRQTRALRRYVSGTNDVDYVELVNEDYGGEGGGNPLEAESFYELRNGELKVAYPVFVDGREIGKSGFVEDTNRREELGKLLIESEFLGKAIVNRMWGHFLGHGFTKPIDDLGPHNLASHPELLDYLGGEVRAANFDLKELIKWITLSRPYSLSSRSTPENESDDPLLGKPPMFSHFYLRQMRAEELFESLIVATEAQKTRGSYEEQEKSKTEWLQQFVVAFGTDEGDETTTFNGTIPQALMMFNGELIKKATNGEKGSMLWGVANSDMNPAQQIEHLFLAGLARKPTRAEITVANRLLTARQQDAWKDGQRPSPDDAASAQLAALQDIWWAVLNSNEFIVNH